MPSPARIRGRDTGTRRPPRLTEPGPDPCRTATRPGLCLPRGPATAVTSASNIACITCSPVPTARASRPSRRSAATSAIATFTCFGTAGGASLAGTFFLWYCLLTAVPCSVGLSWRTPNTYRCQAGDRHLNFHEERDNLRS